MVEMLTATAGQCAHFADFLWLWAVVSSVSCHCMCTSIDHARHFWNWCNICKVVKVVYRNQTDNLCNWSDTWLPVFYHTHTHPYMHTCTHTCTLTCTQTHTDVCTCLHACMHISTQTHTHKHTHTLCHTVLHLKTKKKKKWSNKITAVCLIFFWYMLFLTSEMVDITG